MSERWPVTYTPRKSQAKVRVAAVAAPQGGVVSWAQLRELQVAEPTISRWTTDGYLHPYFPTVYAVGHSNLSLEGRLHAALLYAGPGAALSHTTAAWWWQLTDAEPRTIHVSTPGRRCPQPNLKIHGRRTTVQTINHKRLPVTTVAQTLLDYASRATIHETRRALAEADYQRVLDPIAVQSILGRGAPGSATLRKAWDQHQPKLAHSRSELEQAFLELCERADLPLPSLNAKVAGLTVDALWPEHRVIVELDGTQGHATTAQLHRDRNRDLRLRAAGYIVLRYTWAQITQQPDEVILDLAAALSRSALSA